MLARQPQPPPVPEAPDLLVPDGNPLDNIRHTADARYVMVDGRLFDVAADMAGIGHQAVPAPTAVCHGVH